MIHVTVLKDILERDAQSQVSISCCFKYFKSHLHTYVRIAMYVHYQLSLEQLKI